MALNAARAKVEGEGKCRVCGIRAEHCDAAHTIDRSLSSSGFVDPDLIVPLCSQIKGGAGCHAAYDAHALDLLPYLTRAEEVAMVREVGIERARRRATGSTS
jgi:hypothetical protein